MGLFNWSINEWTPANLQINVEVLFTPLLMWKNSDECLWLGIIIALGNFSCNLSHNKIAIQVSRYNIGFEQGLNFLLKEKADCMWLEIPQDLGL